MLGMVEKVARAICRSMLQDPDIDYEIHHPDGLVKGWKVYESEAKAAIDAMREPTEAMNLAFEEGYSKGFDGIPDTEKLGKDAQFTCFRTAMSCMVDAALKPEA